MSKYQFPPIRDKVRFPLLTAGDQMPCAHLMGCEQLVFFAAEDSTASASVILKDGIEWHLYGDTRWPALSSWLEINTSPGGFSGHSGVLVMTYEIPGDEVDPFDWIARNGPLSQIFPEERSVAVIQKRLEMLQQQATSTENVVEPTDSKPRYVQSYCIYRARQGVRLIACYTDLLNSEGIPLPRYRIANVEPGDIEVCRFTLHSLFCLNQARLAGMKFIATPQLAICEPSYLESGTINPPWALYHPLRVLRTRPAIRSIPTPKNLIDGVMQMETHEQIMEARRLEANLDALAFELGARPRNGIFNDGDACIGAFSHRANGGAIYMLPNRLVEEFDNTDCNEVRMKDIKLPFRNLFLKFAPPQPLFLAEEAPVDGCYIVKQGDEYLFTLTSHLTGVDYNQSLSVVCLDPTFSLHLPTPEFSLEKPAQDTDLSINDAVELGIKDFLERNAPPADNMSQTITRPMGQLRTWLISELKAENGGLKYSGHKNPFFTPASTSSSMQLVLFHFDLKTSVKNGIANRPLG